MKKAIFILSAIIFFTGCTKSNQHAVVLQTGQAVLLSPAENAVCTSGTILSATESSVLFTWSAANNTNSYNLVIKNLLTSDSTIQNTSQTQASVTLLRNTPYRWYVVSVSGNGVAQSTQWKFYNSGPGAVTYAPFPAEITSPTFAQVVNGATGKVNLTWNGSVVTPDIITNYDVYFGTTTSPSITASAISDSFLNNVAVTVNTTYFWRVVTRDVFGNTSDSGLYQFVVN